MKLTTIFSQLEATAGKISLNFSARRSGQVDFMKSQGQLAIYNEVL